MEKRPSRLRNAASNVRDIAVLGVLTPVMVTGAGLWLTAEAGGRLRDAAKRGVERRNRRKTLDKQRQKRQQIRRN